MLPSSGEYLLRRTTPAASTPVTVAEVKSDLRITHTDDDTYIEGLIAAAVEYVSAPNGVTGKALITQTWALSVRAAACDNRIHLPITPVVSVTSIAYYDAAGDAQALDVANFYLYGTEDWSYLEPKSGNSWPGTQSRLDAITVTFVAGFGNAEAVPDNIKKALRLLVAHWYEHREAVVIGSIVTELPLGVAALLGISRKGWVA
jgi:uncharacterized phiE125 gp8 family phage protein